MRARQGDGVVAKCHPSPISFLGLIAKGGFYLDALMWLKILTLNLTTDTFIKWLRVAMGKILTWSNCLSFLDTLLFWPQFSFQERLSDQVWADSLQIPSSKMPPTNFCDSVNVHSALNKKLLSQNLWSFLWGLNADVHSPFIVAASSWGLVLLSSPHIISEFSFKFEMKGASLSAIQTHTLLSSMFGSVACSDVKGKF